jgi:hypothetical protein
LIGFIYVGNNRIIVSGVEGTPNIACRGTSAREADYSKPMLMFGPGSCSDSFCGEARINTQADKSVRSTREKGKRQSCFHD